MENGDQDIAILDINEGLPTNKKDSFRHIVELIGLKTLIFSKRPRLQPLPTSLPGIKTIDGIFGTSTLDIINGGYAPFVGFSNHWLL